MGDILSRLKMDYYVHHNNNGKSKLCTINSNTALYWIQNRNHKANSLPRDYYVALTVRDQKVILSKVNVTKQMFTHWGCKNTNNNYPYCWWQSNSSYKRQDLQQWRNKQYKSCPECRKYPVKKIGNVWKYNFTLYGAPTFTFNKNERINDLCVLIKGAPLWVKLFMRDIILDNKDNKWAEYWYCQGGLEFYKARDEHTCTQCNLPIIPGTDYLTTKHYYCPRNKYHLKCFDPNGLQTHKLAEVLDSVSKDRVDNVKTYRELVRIHNSIKGTGKDIKIDEEVLEC